jgi:outer membrane receptor for ferrienterochelin and colicin
MKTHSATVRLFRGSAMGIFAAMAFACGGRAGSVADSDTSTQNVARLKALSLEELMQVDVDTVTTVSRKSEKANDAPATVIVITANDIRLRGYGTLVDVLRDLPGMETIEYYFSEFGTQVPVRGINGNNKIVVLVNGVRVNPPGGENFPFRSDFSVRNAERIEVVYGPGSTLYGQDAISAVINVITKEPGETLSGEVGVDGGLHSERDGWATFGGPLDPAGKIRLSGHVSYHDSDLTELDQEYSSWWESYREKALLHGSGASPDRQDYGLNAFARLEAYDYSLQVWYRDSKRNSSEGGYPPAYVKEAVWEDRSTVIEGKNSRDLTADVKLDSAVTYNRYEIDPDTRYVFDVPGLTNQWFLNDYKYGMGEGYTLEETARAEISPRVSLLCGAIAGTYSIIPKSTVPGGADPGGDVVVQGGAWEYTIGSDPERYRLDRVVESDYQTYAGYGELAWQMVEDVKAIAGTRVTKDTRFEDVPFTPRAALIYSLTEDLTAKYIFTRAYVAPAPYFANATYDNGTLLATSNPELKPETAETHEVNLTYAQKNICLGVSGYYGEQSDIITVSDTAAPENILARDVYLDGDPQQRRTLVQTINGGDGTRHGVDLYGRARWGDASVWSSYSFVHSEQDEQGTTTDVPGISRHNGRLGVTWAATPKLFITPSLMVRSTPAGVPAGELEHELQNPWRMDLSALCQLSKRVEVFADVHNVTDHHYALSGFGANRKAIPQESLSGVVGVRSSF